MAADIASSVDFGLKLSKRLYYGKDQSLSSPPKTAAMEKSSEGYVPTAVMVYAVISEPSIVDNPDVPSYQPYVHGRCDPPALIPLHMHRIEMEVDCYLDTAFVTVSGTWRVHCVMSSKSCDCRIMIPMGDQGSVLGVEVDDGRRSYHTQLIPMEDAKDSEKVAKAKDGFLLKRQIYTLKVPQVEGGSNIFMKASWSQKLLYEDGKFCLSVPFSFPAYVKPVGKKIAKREKITLSVNPGTGTEVLCKTSSHPLKEVRRQVGKLGFLYDAEVLMWSSADFFFSYDVPSSHIFGGLLLQSASLNDIDQREMFCLYLFPGNSQNRKVFRKEVVFLVDISGSMRDGPIENAKSALLAALSKLSLIDSFNIIAFNVDTQLFSSSMVLATKEAKENATQWISRNFIAEGGTNILLPLTQALEMLEKTSDSIPLIFLITDGAVEDERHICNAVQSSYCNHYFLQMLAQIGRGYYDVAFAVDSVNFQIQRLFNAASSVILANITIDALECLDSLELYPNLIPDLSSGSPLIVSGRYHGNFPDSVKASGLLPDMSNFTVELEVQKSKNIPLDRVFARRQIDILTAHAWLLENKQLEEKVAKMSIQTRVPSEYSHVILVQTDKGKPDPESVSIQEKVADLIGKKIIFLRNLGIGFGNLAATVENRPPSTEEVKLHETSEIMAKAAARCCSRLLDRCCCMCFIQACSWMNDQCADSKSEEDVSVPNQQTGLHSSSDQYKLLSRHFFFHGRRRQRQNLHLFLSFRYLFLPRVAFTLQIDASNESPIHSILCSSLPSRLCCLSPSQVTKVRSSGDGSIEKEKTLAMIKPDGLFGSYTNAIKEIILDSGFSICKEMTIHLDEDTVKSFYAVHSSKSFFPSLVNYMTSGPVLIMVLEKVNAVADWRAMIGPTDARKAKVTHPNSIRAMCGLDSQTNCVHGSDSSESAAREISFFFKEASSAILTMGHAFVSFQIRFMH
ncbi:hypothetical protein TEA_002863 [Camellia sinensis var. sinensis]|uniref:VWFA domain-containing protein n=1 Tax=Camellia sinensis var. sinensis TaxID=542762 RepID=A0A4S4EYY3_CAMSN|nr:hypothetical protein TEA_002863 [Camellia sinensis var. sinensis]